MTRARAIVGNARVCINGPSKKPYNGAVENRRVIAAPAITILSRDLRNGPARLCNAGTTPAGSESERSAILIESQ